MEQKTVYGSSEQVEMEGDHSRPSLGFPLGTALLLIVIFSLSGIFSCCYHWDKLRGSRRHSNTNHLLPNTSQSTSPNLKPTPPCMMMGKQEMKSESVIVIMAGDEIPRFIAMPCPCEPPRITTPNPNYQHPPPPNPQLVVPNPRINPSTPFHIPMYI